jgi:hypothetical protein
VIAAIGIPANKNREIISVDRKMIFNIYLPHSHNCVLTDRIVSNNAGKS